MSFASEIKSELLRIEMKNKCCSRAELCGLVSFGGAVLPGGKLRISTENAATARRCFSLIRDCFGISGEIITNHSRAGKGGNAYAISVDTSGDALRILSGLGFLQKHTVSFRVQEALLENPCCRRAFLRGAFLGGGSVANPEKEYHLELSTPRKALAEDTVQVFSAFGLTARMVQRKKAQVIYFKSSTEIGDVLNIIGAHTAYMELMNVRILKETRNKVNRQVNCETANLDKALEAARSQVEAIRLLEKRGRLAALSPGLREAAELRLAYPEAPLSELGDMLHISKSGINHRMRKIMALAGECKKCPERKKE
ncbi:MAG: DNA-binding protein WhiA [Ruminococcaceae bacterium]|nr:DNA-binding protein WhiA [Oscillospiraceae bacterium]